MASLPLNLFLFLFVFFFAKVTTLHARLNYNISNLTINQSFNEHLVKLNSTPNSLNTL